MTMNRVEELDLYKEYKHAYDKATEQQLKKKIDNGETTLYKVNF